MAKENPKSKKNQPVGDKINSTPTTADSARLYNAQMALNKFYEKEVKAGRIKPNTDPAYMNPLAFIGSKSNFKKVIDGLNNDNLGFYRSQIKEREERVKQNYSQTGLYDDNYKEYFNLTPEQVKKLEYEGLGKTKSGSEYQKYYRDLITPQQNLAAPFALVDKRILPQRIISYSGSRYDYPGGQVTVYDYDPLAIKPYNMRTPQEKIEWEKKYGKKQTTPKKEEEYNKKHPPIYLSDPKDPRIGGYNEKGNQWLYKKPKSDSSKNKTPLKKETKKQESIKKTEPPIQKKQNIYEGTPVYSPGAGSGLPSALMGFINRKGDTSFIKPEDYERFAVPKYLKYFLESKNKKK